MNRRKNKPSEITRFGIPAYRIDHFHNISKNNKTFLVIYLHISQLDRADKLLDGN